MRLKKIMILLVLSAVILAGCGGVENEADNTRETAAENGENTGGEHIDDEERAASDIEPRPAYSELEVRDLGGYTFRIISRSNSNLHWWNLDMWAEEENGDPINDAVFARNSAIEEKYNISITNFHSDDVGGRTRTAVRAGSDEYDIVVIGLNGGQETLTQDGMLFDLNTVPNIDLTQRWWDQRAVEQLSITNRLFATSSDLTIRDKDATIILTFSHTLLQNYGLPNLYELVREGKWTLDKMFDMAKAATVDLNGDGVINDFDQIGLITQTKHAMYLYNAAGEAISRLGEDKLPMVTMYNPRAVEVTELIRQVHERPHTINADGGGLAGNYPDVWDDFQVVMFSENRGLFYHAGMNRVTLLRTMESDFGIIPPPKFNEDQANYHVTVDAWCTSAVSIPVTVPDPATTGLILEALTFESRYTLLPAYYDVNLKTKFARDEESGEMINLILENRFYDLGDVYRWGGAEGWFGSQIGRGSATQTLTTFFERNEDRIQIAIDRTVERLEDIQ